MQFGGFGSQFACYWTGADPEILVPDLGGLSLTDVLAVLYLLFTKCSNYSHSFSTRTPLYLHSSLLALLYSHSLYSHSLYSLFLYSLFLYSLFLYSLFLCPSLSISVSVTLCHSLTLCPSVYLSLSTHCTLSLQCIWYLT